MRLTVIALISYIGLLTWNLQQSATITSAEEKIAPTFQETPTVTPIEHATAVINWGDTTLYIDPVGGARAFENQPTPDLVLITDVHGDHLNAETVEGILNDKTIIIAPQAVADQLPKTLSGQVKVLNNGESKMFMGVEVSAVPMYNLREEAKDFHVKGRGNGYVLEKGGTRMYFSGDTEDIPEMRALKNIDMAFVCMNLPYTMTVASAADAVIEFAPKKVYPYHYRGNPDVSDVTAFKTLVDTANPGIEVVQLDWYPNAPY